MNKLHRRIGVGLAGITAAAVAVIPAGAQDPTSDVHVVHAIPGVTVDVYADGALLLEDFAPNTRTDAVPLPVGDYVIEVFAADADPEADAAVIDQTVTVPAAGLDLDLVAHLAADGTPRLDAFVNDNSRTGDGQARLSVRHTAAAPSVDVRAGGAVLVPGLANPDGATTQVPADTYSVDIAPAGADDAVFGPIDLTVAAGTHTIVYAVGDLAGGSFTVYPFVVDTGAREADRVAGASRIDTAVAISQRAFPDGSDVVYLGRADNTVDAVAAGSLTDGPVLLVPSCGELPAAVADEIARLDPADVIALGGAGAVCDAILEAAASIG